MKRDVFLDLELEEQINYFNKNLNDGISIRKIATDIGISKSITEKFKKYGYILKDNKFVKETGATEKQNHEINIKINNNTSKSIKSVKEKTKKIIETVAETKISNTSIGKIGRPKKQGYGEKHTIIIDSNVWTNLKLYSIKNKTTASQIIETLTKDFLKKNRHI